MAELIKDKKIQVYYDEVVRVGKREVRTRHFIHKENKMLWAHVRDLSQSEVVANQTADIIVNLIFTVNWNPIILERWNNTESPIMIIFRGKTFRIAIKPDEFEYRYGDIKIQAAEVTDTKLADEVYYGE